MHMVMKHTRLPPRIKAFSAGRARLLPVEQEGLHGGIVPIERCPDSMWQQRANANFRTPCLFFKKTAKQPPCGGFVESKPAKNLSEPPMLLTSPACSKAVRLQHVVVEMLHHRVPLDVPAWAPCSPPIKKHHDSIGHHLTGQATRVGLRFPAAFESEALPPQQIRLLHNPDTP